MLQHDFPISVRRPGRQAARVLPGSLRDHGRGPEAARCSLVAGLLTWREPGCEEVLRVWSRARAPDGFRRLNDALIVLRPDPTRPDRARCRPCALRAGQVASHRYNDNLGSFKQRTIVVLMLSPQVHSCP
jgi:hypothetical protein